MEKWSGEKRTAAIAFDVESNDPRIGINLACRSGERDRLGGFNLVCGNATNLGIVCAGASLR